MNQFVRLTPTILSLSGVRYILVMVTMILVFTWISNFSINAQCPQDCSGNFVFIGASAGQNNTGNSNTFVGYLAGQANSSGGANTFLGALSGGQNTTGASNTFVGASSGSFNTTGSLNSFFGGAAGGNNTTGASNTFIGRSAGLDNTTGSNNAFLGTYSGENNTTGINNTYVGSEVARSNTTGLNNVFIGHGSAADNVHGSNNTFIGQESGINNLNGSYNTFIGQNTGRWSTSGSGNIFIGPGMGPVPDSAHNNFRLYIDVDTTFNLGISEPLIYGEFDNDFVKINGTFEVTAGLSNPSSVTIKGEFESIDEFVVLEKVSTLNIREWSYNRDPNVRHIGPTAEDFHEAFHVGSDSKSISTMDADGVALLSIQALKKKNDVLEDQVQQLEQENAALNAMVLDLIERMEKLEQKDD